MTTAPALALFGHNLFGDPVQPPARGPVADAFVEPPFTVLDARSGEWQDRKRAWAAMGDASRSAATMDAEHRAGLHASEPCGDCSRCELVVQRRRVDPWLASGDC